MTSYSIPDEVVAYCFITCFFFWKLCNHSCICGLKKKALRNCLIYIPLCGLNACRSQELKLLGCIYFSRRAASAHKQFHPFPPIFTRNWTNGMNYSRVYWKEAKRNVLDTHVTWVHFNALRFPWVNSGPSATHRSPELYSVRMRT